LAKKRESKKDTPSLFEQVEAVRDLGLNGGVDALDSLISLSIDDDSPAVRLRAAEAASDILSRHRIGAGRADLSVGQRRLFLDQFRRVDPLSNPGLFPFLACLDLPRCLSRILVGLRDPRYDVRLGAALGLRRYCCSWSVFADSSAEKKVVRAFNQSGLKPDVLASLSELVAACGWQSARESLKKLVGREDQAGFAAEAALDTLDVLASVDGLLGIWASNGLDAGEVSSNPQPKAWLVLSPEKGFYFTDGGELLVFKWSASAANVIQVTEGRVKSDWALRRMSLSETGDDQFVQVIQYNTRTFYKHTSAGVPSLVKALNRTKGVRKPLRVKCAEVLELQFDGTTELVSAAVAELIAGK
jgi:hypothetical protein